MVMFSTVSYIPISPCWGVKYSDSLRGESKYQSQKTSAFEAYILKNPDQSEKSDSSPSLSLLRWQIVPKLQPTQSCCQKPFDKGYRSVQVSILLTFYDHLFHTKVFCEGFICLQFRFVIFWPKEIGTKTAHKMLVKLTTGIRLRSWLWASPRWDSRVETISSQVFVSMSISVLQFGTPSSCPSHRLDLRGLRR